MLAYGTVHFWVYIPEHKYDRATHFWSNDSVVNSNAKDGSQALSNARDHGTSNTYVKDNSEQMHLQVLTVPVILMQTITAARFQMQ